MKHAFVRGRDNKCITCKRSESYGAHETPAQALTLNLEDRGQMFAGVATIKAALYDVIDARNIMDLWEGDMNGYAVTEEQANVSRHRFVDAVVARMAEFQEHEGIKLENLCPRHRQEALPKPTVQVCVQCAAEQKAKGQSV